MAAINTLRDAMSDKRAMDRVFQKEGENEKSVEERDGRIAANRASQSSADESKKKRERAGHAGNMPLRYGWDLRVHLAVLYFIDLRLEWLLGWRAIMSAI